ncbi:MAG TPA: FAD-binding oxidoreductase, partial [Bryobacterales bacterium]|nr:FAD-binding oxidoreductase [Bryobacterales bacterium]
PRRLDDIVACLQFAAEQGLSVHPRGAGTGVAGESLGRGIILDLSAHFRTIREIGAEDVVVEPGVVVGQLNRVLARSGRQFGPDPAHVDVSTMGGVVSRNGSGSRFLRYGAARDQLRAVQIVLADGSVHRFSRHTLRPLEPSTGGMWAQRVAELVRRHPEALETYRPEVPSSGAGYALAETVGDDAVDLAKLIAGSEGTLGVLVELRLATHALPACQGVALLFFRRFHEAAQVAGEVPLAGLSACDLLDRRLLDLAAQETATYGKWIPPGTEALLLLEAVGATRAEVAGALQAAMSSGIPESCLAGPTRVSLEPHDVAEAWRLAKHIVARLARLTGTTRPVPFIEDVAVPRNRLASFLADARQLLRGSGLIASFYSHAGHGQVHVRPFLDLQHPGHRTLMPRLARAFFDAVLASGGRISTEHAWGLSRSWYLKERLPALHRLWCDVKELFDPLRLLNPGKLGDPDPPPLTAHLRGAESARRAAAPAPAGTPASGEANHVVGASDKEPTLSSGRA